ncbi:MAG: transporter suffix domain-containing protein [Microbacterium sp.]|nr:transporter suffix domain-containing protein [Microbacterium sp.]
MTQNSPKKKPIRFKIGVGLLILYPLMYLIIPIAPFLPIEVGVKVGLVAAVLGAAEAILLIGIACVGKEAYHAIKAKLGLGKKKRAAEEAARLEAEASTSSGSDSVEEHPGVDAEAATTSLERSSKDDHV